MPWHSMCTRRRMLSHEVISCAGGAGDWQQPAAPMSCPRAVAARAVAATCLSGSQSCGPPTAAHRATTPAAGLLQMATWDEMKEYGVDQNTISYNSLLSRWQLASSWQWRTRHSWLRGVTHQRAPPHGWLPERAAPSWICWRSGTRRHSGVAAATDVRMPGGQRPCTSRQVRLQG